MKCKICEKDNATEQFYINGEGEKTISPPLCEGCISMVFCKCDICKKPTLIDFTYIFACEIPINMSALARQKDLPHYCPSCAKTQIIRMQNSIKDVQRRMKVHQLYL